MPVIKHWTSLFLLVVSLTARGETIDSTNADARENSRFSSESVERLDKAMQTHVDDRKVSGVVGLVGGSEGVDYYGAFGFRDIEHRKPMDDHSLFRIYSMTKPIVAVTAMSLWEEGKFQLDDPISNYLPEWKQATVESGAEVVPTPTPVTPRHLMTHSAGISYRESQLELGEASLEEFSRSVAARPLEFIPGTDYRYGYSIDILGRYIEAIEEKPLDQVMRERVFEVLNMNDTDFWLNDPNDASRVAIVYRKTPEDALNPLMDSESLMPRPPRMMGGQGLISTTSDYARFCQMLLNNGELDGKRILKNETVQLMLENHLAPIDKTYGLGGWADGSGRYLWGGAAGTGFWIDQASDSYAVFMIQAWGYQVDTYDVFKEIVSEGFRDSTSARTDIGRRLPSEE